jgi:hypothetical protein
MDNMLTRRDEKKGPRVSMDGPPTRHKDLLILTRLLPSGDDSNDNFSELLPKPGPR